MNHRRGSRVRRWRNLVLFATAALVSFPAVAAGPHIAGCPSFPANSIYNARIDHLPVHSRSAAWVNSIGKTTGLHADFGSGKYDGHIIGIPINTVAADRPKQAVVFAEEDESDPGPYPIPAKPRIEAPSDRHLLTVQKGSCGLFELYATRKNASGQWTAYSGATWNLRSNALRPATWTSADAAGLPIAPLLVRQPEVAAGVIRHAIRFTANRTQRAFLWPARHQASDITDPNVPPMGARFRLKAGFDLTGYPADVQVILTAMKRYGMILADNGSDWYVSGTSDSHWDNDTLHTLGLVTGSSFEAVDESGLMAEPDSGRVR